MKIDPENRRSFVKKSLVTSMSVSFAGLIRAHGNGSTGETTFDPENTYVTTSGGTTTTFDLEETVATTDEIEDEGPWKARTGNPESLNIHHQWSEFTYDGVDYRIKNECIYQGLESNVKWNFYTHFTQYEATVSARPDPGVNYAKCTPKADNPCVLSKQRRVDLRCAPGNGAITVQGPVHIVANGTHAEYDHANKKFKLEVLGIVSGATTGHGGRTVYTRDKVLTKLSVLVSNGVWQQVTGDEVEVSSWEILVPEHLRPPLDDDDEETPDYDERDSADGDGAEKGWWIVSKSERINP
jgi:hypothetical protein